MSLSNLRDRAAAWWSAWQFVVYLALALLLSIAANVWQWKRAITAPLRGENKALTEAMATFTGIAKQRDRDDHALMTDLEAIAERGRTDRVIYRKAAAATPLAAVCAPGQARVDAINHTLGPQGRPPESPRESVQ